MTLAAGTALGPYEILNAIGAGGMGEVYRARDRRLNRDVAIKILQETAQGGAAWERFQHEARAASSLNHPHICAVFDVGEADGRPFLVMELINGQTLQAFLGGRPVDAATAIRFGIQIGDALDTAHASGIIHRDIKPGNIMIVGGRHVKLLDFGIAKRAVLTTIGQVTTMQELTETGTMLGTPHYMAPELLLGHAAGVPSDLWAFGVVLYVMLSARLPFQGTSAYETASHILREPLPPLADSVPRGLRAVVERCLAKRPDDRFRSSAETREALEALGAAAPSAPIDLPGEGPLTALGSPGSANPEANDAFALAVQFMRVQNDLSRAQTQLERALELDPHFAEARRNHGFNLVLHLLNGDSNDGTLLYRAEEDLRRAQADDPSLPSLPSAFAAVYFVQGRRDMIPAADLEQASLGGSAMRESLLWRAIIAWNGGDTETAKGLVRRALEREPLFGAPRMILAEALRADGDPAGAVREQLRVLEQAPANISAIHWLTLAYLDIGELGQARALLENQRPLFGGNFLWRAAWALLLACEGRREEALAAMDAGTLKFARLVFIATLDVAEFFAVLGDDANAVEWLAIAVRNGDERVNWFRRDPRLSGIRNDPRFQLILQSIEQRKPSA